MTQEPSPYRIQGPAIISFSGGRTSAYMLHEIIRAHGGTLPPDVIPCFANTGKEREETLRFVHECGSRWGAIIRWLEWRDTDAGFEEVGLNSASRAGEPFAALIRKKAYLPNAVTRFCTQELKIRVMRDFCRSLGWKRWVSVVGLRYDEGHRVLKALARNESAKEAFVVAMPLSKAHITNRVVLRFWLGDNADPVDLQYPLPQGFDLGLRGYEGNCDLCFLKSRRKLTTIMRDQPDSAKWWADREREVRSRFVIEYGYTTLAQEVRDQGHLFDGWLWDDEEHDVECGLHCEPAEAA